MPRSKVGIVRWQGEGRGYVPGIPQRDLTMAEWIDLTDSQRQTALDTGLYVMLESGRVEQVDTAAQTAEGEE